MDILNDIDLFDCPICRGAGLLEEECGCWVYVTCMECGCHTAAISFRSEEERITATKQSARLWNIGKVISSSASE